MPVALPASMSACAVGDLVERVGAVDRHLSGGRRRRRRGRTAGRRRGGRRRFAAVGGQPHARRDVVDRVEVGDGPLVAEHPGEADDAVDGGRAEGVGQGVACRRARARRRRRPGRSLADLRRDLAVVDEQVVDADRLQRVGAVGRRVVERTVRPRSLARTAAAMPDRRGAAADQQRLAGLGVEADGQRAVGGLQHLGHRAERRPVELGAETG